MIPINPLDGGRVLGIFLPHKWANFLMMQSYYNIYLLLIIIFILPKIIGIDILEYYFDFVFYPVEYLIDIVWEFKSWDDCDQSCFDAILQENK